MDSKQYQYKTRNIDAFLAQLVRYIVAGHYFYVRLRVPAGKDPDVVAEKLLNKYEIKRSRWQRKRRNLKKNAGIHLLLYRDVIVIILTKGTNNAFYGDHANSVQDIRRNAVKIFGFKVRYSFSQLEKRMQVFVRLDEKTYRQVKSNMLTICCWDAYKDKKVLEREFRRLNYQRYGPVVEQLLAIVNEVNKARRKRGFNQVSPDCIGFMRRLEKVFVDDETIDESA